MLAATSPVTAMFNAPLMPTPPTTTRAPVVVLVLAVPELARILPLLVTPVSTPTRVILGCCAEPELKVPVSTVPTLPMSEDLTLAETIPALKILRPL